MGFNLQICSYKYQAYYIFSLIQFVFVAVFYMGCSFLLYYFISRDVRKNTQNYNTYLILEQKRYGQPLI